MFPDIIGEDDMAYGIGFYDLMMFEEGIDEEGLDQYSLHVESVVLTAFFPLS